MAVPTISVGPATANDIKDFIKALAAVSAETPLAHTLHAAVQLLISQYLEKFNENYNPQLPPWHERRVKLRSNTETLFLMRPGDEQTHELLLETLEILGQFDELRTNLAQQ
jgi:hypothetical protein